MSEEERSDFKKTYYRTICRINFINNKLKQYRAITPLSLDLYEQELISLTQLRNVLELRGKVENVKL